MIVQEFADLLAVTPPPRGQHIRRGVARSGSLGRTQDGHRRVTAAVKKELRRLKEVAMEHGNWSSPHPVRRNRRAGTPIHPARPTTASSRMVGVPSVGSAFRSVRGAKERFHKPGGRETDGANAGAPFLRLSLAMPLAVRSRPPHLAWVTMATRYRSAPDPRNESDRP
jgi:hypothetical protein